MTQLEERHLLVEIDRGVGVITLNRPDRLNAFNREMTSGLFATLAELDAREDVSAIVVTGAGRVFSAGADLADDRIFAHDDGPWILPDRPRPWLMRTPIIGALNGSAVGMGLSFTLSWDIRFMAQDAKYNLPFTRLGIFVEGNSSWLLPRMIGHSRAVELLLTGRSFDGHEAERIGLATRALPAEQVLTTALDCAHDIAANTSKLSVAEVKVRLYQAMEESSREASERLEAALFGFLGALPDAEEGVRAYKEKREPQWTGQKRGSTVPF